MAYNVYQGDVLIAEKIKEKEYTVEGLEPNAEYSFSVSEVVGDKESEKTAVTVKTKPINVTGVSLSPKTSTAEAGVAGNRNLNATIQPESATYQKYTFETEGAVGLSVSNAGILEWTADTPPGTYATTVTTADGGFTDTHVLTLTEPEETDPIVEGPESIEISPKTHTFIPQWEPGAQKKLTVTILPEDADQGYTYESSDTSIADTKIHGSVYGLHDFFVTAESPGTATITVTSVNGLTASCTVTIPEQD